MVRHGVPDLRFLAVLFASVLVFMFARTCRAQVDSEDATREQTISAHGRVVDLTGKPIGGASVVLREWSNLRYGEDVYAEKVNDVLATVETDSTGTFQFNEIKTRTLPRYGTARKPWDIIATAAGYALAWEHITNLRGSEPTTLTLVPEAIIDVDLVTLKGEPIVGARVNIVGIGPPGGRPFGPLNDPDYIILEHSQLGPTAVTDAKGHFQLRGLPPEQLVTLFIRHDEYVHRWVWAATTSIPQPPLKMPRRNQGRIQIATETVYPDRFALALDSGRHLTGRVLDDRMQKPVAGARVELSVGQRANYALCDSEGRYAFHGLPVGVYVLSAESPIGGNSVGRRVPVRITREQQSVNVDLSLPAGQSITGKVVDDQSGEGVAGVLVHYDAAATVANQAQPMVPPALTDAQGRFRLLLPPGKGQLKLSGPVATHYVPDTRTADGPANEAYRRAVDLQPGSDDVGEIVFRIGRGLVIEGVVVDPQDMVLADARILVNAFGSPDAMRRTALTDAHGRFVFLGLSPTERHELTVMHRARNLVAAHILAAHPTAETVRSEFVKLRVKQAGTVTGRVLRDGGPFAGVRAQLFTETIVNETRVPVPAGESVATDDNGRFTIPLAEPGREYVVGVRPAGYRFHQSRRMTLQSGEVLDLPPFDMPLLNQSLSGTVVDAEDKPVAGAIVIAVHAESHELLPGRTQRVLSGNDGRFTLAEIPDVAVSVTAYLAPPGDKQRTPPRASQPITAQAGDQDVRIVIPREGTAR